MSSVIESYNLGSVHVEISETKQSDKLQVECNDGNYHSSFSVSKYEYKNYKRHMNQRISNAYKEQYEEE